ncbi:hypothetical protein [Gemmiger formicilis]|uniref:HNH endonuclease n=1 Tax=Gemmiger formicilis TaxID=745368 RepID=UPI003D72E978
MQEIGGVLFEQACLYRRQAERLSLLLLLDEWQKADWEKVMLAKRRKTIVVCHKCHMRIHHGTKTE